MSHDNFYLRKYFMVFDVNYCTAQCIKTSQLKVYLTTLFITKEIVFVMNVSERYTTVEK